jgi:hypothetical protein
MWPMGLLFFLFWPIRVSEIGLHFMLHWRLSQILSTQIHLLSAWSIFALYHGTVHSCRALTITTQYCYTNLLVSRLHVKRKRFPINLHNNGLKHDTRFLRFYVPLKNFSLIGRRHHCRWRATKFSPMLGAQGLWAGRDFYRAHLLWHGASVFPVSSEGPLHSVASYDTL